MKYRHLRVAHLSCAACVFLMSVAAVGASTLEEGIRAYESGDYQTAIEKWHTLVQQGNADGMFYLGVMYAGGKGLPQDKAKAFQLYSEAAQKDHLSAQYNLGMQYATGEGVTQDFSKAEYWWTKAAQRGLMQAQFNLGNLYYYGLTGEKKPAMARKWLTLAAKQGSPYAKETLAKLDVEEAQTPNLSPRFIEPDVKLRKSTEMLRREAWVLAQPPGNYTIQVLSAGSESAVLEFITRHGLSANVACLETLSDRASIFRVFYGSYPSRDLADKALATLPRTIDTNSLSIRTFAEVQNLVDRRYAQRGAP
jgi:Sel1 repeat-containing protein/sporulation related protein